MDNGPEATLDVVNDLYEVYKHIFYEKKIMCDRPTYRHTDGHKDGRTDGRTYGHTLL